MRSRGRQASSVSMTAGLSVIVRQAGIIGSICIYDSRPECGHERQASSVSMP